MIRLKRKRVKNAIEVFEAENPVLARTFHVESEFEVKKKQMLQPEGENNEKQI